MTASRDKIWLLMRLGVHVSIAGGVLEAIPRAERLACTAMQIFSRSPRGGPAPTISREHAVQFDQARRAAGLTCDQLAARLGTAPSVLQVLERSAGEGHGLDMLRRIADVLEMDLQVGFTPRR